MQGPFNDLPQCILLGYCGARRTPRTISHTQLSLSGCFHIARLSPKTQELLSEGARLRAGCFPQCLCSSGGLGAALPGLAPHPSLFSIPGGLLTSTRGSAGCAAKVTPEPAALELMFSESPLILRLRDEIFSRMKRGQVTALFSE